MVNEETVSKLKKILSAQLGMDETDIELTSRLVDNLGADSLDMIEIVMDVEHAFGITVSDDEYANCNTVSLIADLIEKKLKDK